MARLAWVLVLVAAAVVVAFGGGPARAAGAAPPAAAVCFPVPCPTTTVAPPPLSDTTTTTTTATSTTAPTTPPTTVPTTAPPSTVPAPGFTAAFVPCGSTAGPCDQEPQQVQVGHGTAAPAAVQLSWVAAGRAPGAPAPGSTSVTLLWGDGNDCGTADRCWQWPAQMTGSSYILDGTYQVTACDTYTGGQCQASSAPVTIGLAVPPGPPTGVQVKADGSAAVVSWHPPSVAPPDLVGYRITRDGRPIWTCSTDGLGPGRGVRCPPSMAVADQPGAGTFTYTVAALRLGADTSDRGVVSSAGVGGVDGGRVTVAAAAGPPESSGTPGAAFTPSPVIGGQGTTASLAPLQSAAPGASGVAPPAGSPASVQNLKYPAADDPVVGHTAMALQVHPSASRTDLVPVTVLALGLLILAVAAHFLYLRVAVGAVQGRMSGVPRRQT